MKHLKLFTLVLLFILMLNSNFSYSQTGWVKLDPNHSVTRDLIDIKIFDSNFFYIFADSNYFIKSTDGGVTLSQHPWNLSTKAVYFKDLNNGYAMKGKILWKTHNAGVTWDSISDLTSFFNGQYYDSYNLTFLNDNFGFVTLKNGGMQWNEIRILFTTNGGYTWSYAGANSYSSGSSTYYTSERIIDFNMQTVSTGYFIKHMSVSSQFGQGPESYSLFKTTNGGGNWINIISNLNTTKVYSLNFLNANTGFAVIDSLRFLKTTDSGNSWDLVSYLPAHIDKLFMIDELNGYAIDLIDFYRTTDGGITWVLQNLNLNISTGYSKISFINPQLGYVVGRNGLILKTTTGGTVFVNNNSQIVNGYYLSQNYPNPFNPETKIQFSIPKNSLVKIAVYDLQGREVKQLINEFRQSGSHNVSFNGADLSSGIYFYKLITDDFVETKKMILLK